MTEWKTYKIGGIGKIITGKTPKTSIIDNYGGNIPFLTPSDELSGKYAPQTVKTLTQRGLSEVKNCLLPPNAVCVSCIGSDLGKVVKATSPTVTNQQFNSIIPNEDFDSDFVYYLMTVAGKELNYLSKTSTAVPIINKTQFSNFEVKVPPLEEQRRIAGILGAIDDKIENNRRINANLELQAQALYKQWFVDFEFPNEDGKPYKSSGGKMVDSELGPIPEGWRVQTFGDLIKPQKGKNITRAQVTIGSVPVVAGGLMPSCYHNTSNTHCPVVTISASGANAGYVKMYHMPIWAADCSYIDDTISKYVHFAYVFLTYNQTSIYHKQQGCAQPHIYPSHLMELQFICPTLDILDKFESWSKKIYKLIGTNIQENETLATLRDTLLPKLMNGEIKTE